MSGVDTVEAEVRELVRRRGLDPIEDRAAVRRLVDEVVADYDERTLTSTLTPLSDARIAARKVYDAVAGFGPLQRYLDDPTVEEIWINEPGRVFIARRGQSELTMTILSDGQVRDLVENMLKTTGRRVDLSTPFVDAILPNHPGSRPRPWATADVEVSRSGGDIEDETEHLADLSQRGSAHVADWSA